MAITIAEAQERRTEARRMKLESSVIEQWYYCLGTTLVEQAEKGLDEPDFSSRWIMCPDGLLQHLRRQGVEVSADTWHEPVIAFINELIGDQLEEYGIEVQLHLVHDRMEWGSRLYLLKPGQKPRYN